MSLYLPMYAPNTKGILLQFEQNSTPKIDGNKYVEVNNV